MARAAAIELIMPHYQMPAAIEATVVPLRAPGERKAYDWSAIRTVLLEPETVTTATAAPQPEMLFYFAD